METLIAMDDMGIIPSQGEDADAFARRVTHLRDSYLAFDQDFNSRRGQFFNEFAPASAERIPPDILEEAAEVTKELFDFSIDWVPAFFLSKGLGFIWGGCTLVDEKGVSVFIIRKNFAKKQRWFIYNRSELLSHEICHVARAPLEDDRFEEHFAYMTAHSPFRKYIGNCFQDDRDAVLFVLPVFLLLAVQIAKFIFNVNIPSIFFWILAFAWPLYLLLRNAISRHIYFKAFDALKKIGLKKPRSILFRSTSCEINEIAKFADNPDGLRGFIDAKAEKELGWRIIKHKFIDKGEF